MKKLILLLSAILCIALINLASANHSTINTIDKIETPGDSLRLAELDRFWAELARTVREGDFEGFRATCLDDGFLVRGDNKTMISMGEAVEGWKQGFIDTKAGKSRDNVEFRFSQRIGNETAAHETGIFYFTTADSIGNVTGKYIIHFEELLVKRDGHWMILMEYQKSKATQEEWDAMK